MSDTMRFDLDAYLRRIGWEGERRADAATLRGVHLAHMRAIPFENLDALRRTAPSLDPADLMAKLVHSRRGGYCYEHNTLFACALEALGLTVTRLAARVVVGADRIESRPRTHMALLVEAPGDPQPYLADVGFGAIGALLEPVPLTAGVEFRDAERRHRLAHAPHDGPLELWLLQAHDRAKDDWADQYAFTLEPFEKPDFEVINWHIGTNPRSPFTQRVYVQSVTAERHLLLNGRLLTDTRVDGTAVEREVTEEAEARRLLEEEFGIDVPEGMRLLPQ
ncbi:MULTISPECIES: arylamine N-acetyltransferase [unclassified Streptomyces]|uniref:arylamine N-acetyltransferase family protein n=1 Tax=unclassified Streptomyces TaxID=2593676 RepID=UPI00236587A3|nr:MULTISPECIES: arylamine N-acetyltransferase [unclassified Streptomyces]MDF3147953.1 arylamine N-acetyltransferase [Streptomyces sp. T21Q-yed]WDF40325.1 arylamine N-acetyltransferase [Streptomyces sp. T12]